MGPASDLQAEMRGRVLTPDDGEYEAARSLWNAMIDSRPALIARCAGVADVVAAVDFARGSGLEIAVKGGGHNVAGLASCDGGIVIDLSDMTSVRVDQARRTARAEGGVTWGVYDRETQLFGLASSGGAISSTGIAGLTLGGGFGWLSRSFGLACDCLVSADVVTADGRVLTASAEENEDLFWGLRGGGGNFGIVTSFEYRLHPVGELLAGLLVYPRAETKEVLGVWSELTREAPDELGSMAALLNTPDGDPITAVFAVYNGPIADGEKVLAPLRSHPALMADDVTPKPYRVVQVAFDEGFPPGKRDYWKSHFIPAVGEEFIEALVESAASAPSPASLLAIEHLFGGAVSRVPADATAYGPREAEYNLLINAVWEDASEDEANKSWARRVFQATEPHSTGAVYVNYLNAEESDRIEQAYGADLYARLVELKDRYDPENLFHRNQNIAPSQ